MRPLYRRYRTVSESNNEADPSQAQSELVDEDVARPRQGGRRPRNFRRHDGGRVRSEGTNEVQVVEGDVEKQDKSDVERNGTLAKTRTEADAEGEYPHDAIPRQRRRPQRRIPRHRSAPTEGPETTEAHHSEGNGNSQAPEFHAEPTWQPRRFRRPFRPRGGFRSMNGTWNSGTSANDTNGVPHGYRNYQAGDRNGFDRGPRRRGYGGGHFRGQRRGPRPTGDWNAPTNGIPAATETDKVIAHDGTEHTVSVDDVANGIQQVELSNSPKLSEESSGSVGVSNEA
ncbi:Nuclease-sensitive element-binding protein 1 [Paragonimus heterotremus]|uniref:Nuclease-sensitive element-binding protein 1 n=1 Tax=Paragonimus heterotremus TaxID=100268 RepID=A0A8J4T2E1_9TREM|nr:Nuclease-sensitive element-binding protein 1 [Paragonimus heterotremus]